MDLIDDPTPGGNLPEYTVTEVSGAVKRTLEDAFGRIRVKGEVGRVFRARSGHLYFDVKDERNVLACTTWKGQIPNLSVVPEEGLEVVVTGKMTSFGGQSKYNLNVEEVSVAGVGALMAMFEKRKKALEAEGLFAESRKRKLPFLPEVIGVVTSPSGAVIRDILHRLRERFPRKVLVWPVAVQGQACAPEVARAIAGFNALSPGGALPRPDLLIVARGGGSIEDLWGFNEEIVARAAAASEIPLVSAVGHETDTTLIDYVADRRAPTPTAAAEIAVPVRAELRAWLDGQGARMSHCTAQGLVNRGQRLRDLARGLGRPQSLVEAPRQRLDAQDHRLPRALTSVVQAKRHRLSEASGGLRPAGMRARLAEARRRLDRDGARLAPGLQRLVNRQREELRKCAIKLRPEPLSRAAERDRRRLAEATARLSRCASAQERRRAERVAGAARLLETLSYKATLSRGYAVVRGDGAVVTRAAEARKAVSLEIEFADGRMTPGGGAPKRARKGDEPPEQGSLF
ncbi:exodeoxyribonuclease VII large subunit [Histidinibacterium aquaticum]|uniref:Exodeoxyribonuclease 7 large subunit n=1 Tax=Histidinibacterium aquaticum TaxID=2613962 RepID=A0A5J5GPB6_9RHOB|nr:exodeoxyribonuclease VII large subunit [Histidinibacterium aquaticum]KAA9010226.1 exodeoxyribonuclease VII large subunit [Histidinibacterium aquaticum]